MIAGSSESNLMDNNPVTGGESDLPTTHRCVSPALHACPLLSRLLESMLVLEEDWLLLPSRARKALLTQENPEQLLTLLVEEKLITAYLAERIRLNQTFGLVLGNYRVLSPIGQGGMGVVFRAEHLSLRKTVAIKVLQPASDRHSLVHRFKVEMRSVAGLNHPHVVGAIDSGVVQDEESDTLLHYFVMELVEGADLEEMVAKDGPIPQGRACDLIYQIASALMEADRHGLVHRDIKPSNVRVTSTGQAKLVDFGLARHPHLSHSEEGKVLGTLSYVAPEQFYDSESATIQADIYGLGGTLFWCLTGREPFETGGNRARNWTRRCTSPPPCPTKDNPRLSPELGIIVQKMMAPDPENRYLTPLDVMRALHPFLEPLSQQESLWEANPVPIPATASLLPPPVESLQRILIVDDDVFTRHLCRETLEQQQGLQCEEVGDGLEALKAFESNDYDLVLLDVKMPGLCGPEVCRRLRADPARHHLKIVMMSSHATTDELSEMLDSGVDDFLAKPFSTVELLARLRSALRLKQTLERADLLNRKLLQLNHRLGENLSLRTTEIVQAREAFLQFPELLMRTRLVDSSSQARQVQRLCACLAEEAANSTLFQDEIDAGFVEALKACALLYDVGKLALPDHILLKAGPLDPNERRIMQSHTIIAADLLDEIAGRDGLELGLLQMARDVARHHHERYDGRGYPDRLTGSEIPLAARLITICDVYSALRARRAHRPALPHSTAVQIMLTDLQGCFDPSLLQGFLQCLHRFERISAEV